MAEVPKQNLPPESQDWRRWVESNIGSLTSGATANNIDNSFKGVASSMNLLTQQVNAIPIPVTGYNENLGFTGSTSFALYTDVIIPIPINKSRASIIAVASASAVDMTSGGLATMYGYIEYGGTGLTWGSPDTYASKDAGASAVNNNVTIATGYQWNAVAGSSMLVSFALTATNTTVFTNPAGSFATITVQAIFSN